MTTKFNWYASCSYDHERKKRFHLTARSRLRQLAKQLGQPYDLRSNLGGIAVSGEITLHTDNVYIQVSQPFSDFDSGIMIRTCTSRKDYTGGPNLFAPLSRLDHIPNFASEIQRFLDNTNPLCAPKTWARVPAELPRLRA